MGSDPREEVFLQELRTKFAQTCACSHKASHYYRSLCRLLPIALDRNISNQAAARGPFDFAQGRVEGLSSANLNGTVEAGALNANPLRASPFLCEAQDRHCREPLLADVNHHLILLSALGIFAMLANGNRLVIL